MPRLHEDYLRYTPPAWVIETVRQLLDALPNQSGGLSAIVLTESARIPKGRTRRVAGKKYARRDCLGFYCPRSSRGPASILLVVDNILNARPPRQGWTPFQREYRLASVLFHEIGHHLNHTRRSVAAGEEASADEWERRLVRSYFASRYPVPDSEVNAAVPQP